MKKINEKLVARYLKFLQVMITFEIVMFIVSFFKDNNKVVTFSLLALFVFTTVYVVISKMKNNLLYFAGYVSVFSLCISLYIIFLSQPLLINLFFLVILMPVASFFNSHKLNLVTFLLLSISFCIGFLSHYEQFKPLFDKEDVVYFTIIFSAFVISMTFHLHNQKNSTKEIDNKINEATNLNIEMNKVVSELEENRQKVEDFSVNLDLSMKETNTSVSIMSTSFNEMKTVFDFQNQNIQKIYENTTDHLTNVQKLNTASSNIVSNTSKVKEVLEYNDLQIKSLRGLIEHISNDFNTTLTSSKNLELTTNEVTTILQSINRISNKVRMLALNASIEAAKAGEHGSGFKVVAGEIRDLADSTTVAVEDISTLLHKMKEETSSLSSQIERSSKKIEDNKHSIVHLDNSFTDLKFKNDSIFRSISSISEVTEELDVQAENTTSALQEFSTSSEEISSNLVNLVSNFEEISASFNDVSIGFRELHRHIKKESN